MSMRRWLAIAALALGAAAAGAGSPAPKRVTAVSAPAAQSPVKPGNGC